METTTAPASLPYLVVIDPTNARTIVADYATYTEAQGRVDREVASRLNGRGGSVYIYEAGEAVTIYRVNPADGCVGTPAAKETAR